MRPPRASSEGRARPGEGARGAPRGWPDPLEPARPPPSPSSLPPPTERPGLRPPAGRGHRRHVAQEGGSIPGLGVRPAFPPADYGGLGRGLPGGLPPTSLSGSPPPGWPAAEAPTLGVLAEDAAALSGLKARLRSPPSPEDHREPRPPHPQAQPQPLPLGRRFTTSRKTPLSVCKAPGLPGDAHPSTPAPPSPSPSSLTIEPG